MKKQNQQQSFQWGSGIDLINAINNHYCHEVKLDELIRASALDVIGYAVEWARKGEKSNERPGED